MTETVQISQNLIAWLASGERGVSSNTIVERLTGISAVGDWGQDHPLDPADLMRCRKLLSQCPELRTDFHKMADCSDEWKALIENWDDLCQMMDREAPDWLNGQGRAKETYDFMQRLFNRQR